MCGQWVSFRWVPCLPPPQLYQGLLEDRAESLPSDWELCRAELCFLLLAHPLVEAVVAPGRLLLSAFIGSPPLPPLWPCCLLPGVILSSCLKVIKAPNFRFEWACKGHPIYSISWILCKEHPSIPCAWWLKRDS